MRPVGPPSPDGVGANPPVDGLQATSPTEPAATSKVLAAGSNPSAGTTVPADPFDRTAVPIGSANEHDHPGLIAIDASHYVLAQELARGGMGRIRLARDRRLGRQVAVKEVLARDGDLASRFEREARITARLQHPSIMSVYEAAVWPSGLPFFAMPLVKGRSLDEVIAENKTLAERMALLPNALAVADAIAYAHGERVIHRDLKPKNVLVGSFGETVVIDWGLAKDLADPRDARPDGPFRTAGPDVETELGEVMGTPAYMPPEQARGESVDERADVYAIGALLTHVLTGKPPYVGRSTHEIVEAVKAGPPVPLAQRAPETPVELVAIVERAMARDPAARYPTARELAEDLRRYQTGQLVGAHRYSLRQLLWRWIRRHRTPLIVAGVAAVVLIVFAVAAVHGIVQERERADQQRGLAVTSQGRAEDLTRFMLFELHDKLDGVGRLDLLETVADKAAGYYVARGAGASEADEARRSAALSNIGDVLAVRGDKTGALAQYQAALAIAQELALVDPASRERQLALSNQYDHLATIEEQLGDTRASEMAYRTSLAIAEGLSRDAPATPAVDRAVASAQLQLGHILAKRADLPGALALFRAALGTAEHLVRGAPTDVTFLKLLVSAHGHLAEALRETGDGAGSLAHRRAALATTETLAAGDPSNATLEYWRWTGYFDLAESAGAAGDVAEAKTQYRTALAIAEHLVVRDPANTTWQTALINTHDELGNLLLDAKDADGALAVYRSGLTILEQLPKRGQPLLLHGIAAMHQRIGNVWWAKQDPKHAIEEYRPALEKYDMLAALDPANVDWQRDTELIRVDLGDALAKTPDLDAAEEMYRRAVGLAETIAARDATNVETQSDLALARMGLANLMSARGRVADALAEARAARSIFERLVSGGRATAAWSEALVEVRATIATLEKRAR